jgi:hypothetical protein
MVALGLRLLVFLVFTNCTQAESRKSLRIGLGPATYLPWISRDETTGTYDGGFLVEFYKELGSELNMDIEFVPINDPNYYNAFLSTVVKGLEDDLFDMSWDASIQVAPAEYLSSPPIFVNEYMLLTKRTASPVDIGQVFAPFEDTLWMAITGSIIYAAVVMAVLQQLQTGCSLSDSIRSLPSCLYHSTAALLGGDEYDLYHLGWLRLSRLGLLFLVLVLSATYTANLAAFLTKPNFVIHGPSTMEALKTAKVCTRWTGYDATYLPFVGELITPPATMPQIERTAWAQEKLQSEECSAIIEIGSMAVSESLENCDIMFLNKDLSFVPLPVVSILPARNSEEVDLWRNVSNAVLATLRKPIYTTIRKNNMRFGETCADATTSSLAKISATQMSAAFVVFFGCGTLAIILTVVQRFFFDKGAPLSRMVKGEVQNEKLDAKMDQMLAKLHAASESLQALHEGNKSFAGGMGQSTCAASIPISISGLESALVVKS